MKTMSALFSVMLSAMLFSLPGCAKKDDKGGGGDKAGAGKTTASSGKTAGGCDRRAKEKLCGEYYGAAKTDWVKKECPQYGGATFVDACPKEGAVGRCVKRSRNRDGDPHGVL